MEIRIPRHLQRGQFAFERGHECTFEMKNRRIPRPVFFLPLSSLFQEALGGELGIFLPLLAHDHGRRPPVIGIIYSRRANDLGDRWRIRYATKGR